MKQQLHFEILDKNRIKILPLLKTFKGRFYLAGGTALALQLGHRDSVDFDFFTDTEFDPSELLRELRTIFSAYPIDVIQAGNMTLNVVVGEEIKMSFFYVKDRLIGPLIDAEYFELASLADIACMKIVALLRAELKDYVDLFFIFKTRPLEQVLADCQKKYDRFDAAVYLKALVSFDDINITDILFVRGKKVGIKTIRGAIEAAVSKYLKAIN